MAELTAAACEGYLAFQTRKECRYGPEQTELRTEWAIGFSLALSESNASKVWYMSRTLWGCTACFIAGVGLLVYGTVGGPTPVGGAMYSSGAAGLGGGLTLGSIAGTFFRLITDRGVTLSSGYGNQSWGN